MIEVTDIDPVTLRLIMNEEPVADNDGLVWVCDACGGNWANCWCRGSNGRTYASKKIYCVKGRP